MLFQEEALREEQSDAIRTNLVDRRWLCWVDVGFSKQSGNSGVDSPTPSWHCPAMGNTPRSGAAAPGRLLQNHFLVFDMMALELQEGRPSLPLPGQTNQGRRTKGRGGDAGWGGCDTGSTSTRPQQPPSLNRPVLSRTLGDPEHPLWEPPSRSCPTTPTEALGPEEKLALSFICNWFKTILLMDLDV